jgi:hypothetical protein
VGSVVPWRVKFSATRCHVAWIRDILPATAAAVNVCICVCSAKFADRRRGDLSSADGNHDEATAEIEHSAAAGILLSPRPRAEEMLAQTRKTEKAQIPLSRN